MFSDSDQTVLRTVFQVVQMALNLQLQLPDIQSHTTHYSQPLHLIDQRPSTAKPVQHQFILSHWHEASFEWSMSRFQQYRSSSVGCVEWAFKNLSLETGLIFAVSIKAIRAYYPSWGFLIILLSTSALALDSSTLGLDILYTCQRWAGRFGLGFWQLRLKRLINFPGLSFAPWLALIAYLDENLVSILLVGSVFTYKGHISCC